MNLQAVLEYLFPPQCGGCARPGWGLCEECAPPCAAFVRRLETITVSAAGLYEGPLRRAVLALKSGRRDVARAAALRLADMLQERCPVVPVPTTAARRRERGFDGCVLMANVAAAWNGSIVLPHLRQVRGDRQRGRSRVQRLAARGRFLWHGEPLNGMSIVLLDDVVTTGATLEDCARAVRDAGGAVSRAVALALTA
ncbi:MAG: ComF family protein [Candidatus Baltobacteraceae bacterium]